MHRACTWTLNCVRDFAFRHYVHTSVHVFYVQVTSLLTKQMRKKSDVWEFFLPKILRIFAFAVCVENNTDINMLRIAKGKGKNRRQYRERKLKKLKLGSLQDQLHTNQFLEECVSIS